MNELFGDDFFADVVNEYSDSVYKVALNITKNKEDAFDVCQDVFTRLVKNRSKIKDGEHLKAWLLRAAVNCSKNNVTQAFKRHSVPLDNAKDYQYTDKVSDNYLLSAVMSLPEKYSSVIHLYYYEDYKVDEIAEILKLKPSAVKSRLSRGRGKLKKLLEENYYD